MINRRVLGMAITVSVLILTVSSLGEVPADAARTRTGTVTITVDNNIDGRLKPVQGAIVTIRDTSLTGITDRRGQISFSSANIISGTGTSVPYWADATYTESGITHSGCINFGLVSSSTSVKSTIILDRCASPSP